MVWDVEVTIVEARLAILKVGVVTILIPSEFIQGDSYRVKVLARETQTLTPLVDAAIRVSR